MSPPPNYHQRTQQKNFQQNPFVYCVYICYHLSMSRNQERQEIIETLLAQGKTQEEILATLEAMGYLRDYDDYETFEQGDDLYQGGAEIGDPGPPDQPQEDLFEDIIGDEDKDDQPKEDKQKDRQRDYDGYDDLDEDDKQGGKELKDESQGGAGEGNPKGEDPEKDDTKDDHDPNPKDTKTKAGATGGEPNTGTNAQDYGFLDEDELGGGKPLTAEHGEGGDPKNAENDYTKFGDEAEYNDPTGRGDKKKEDQGETAGEGEAENKDKRGTGAADPGGDGEGKGVEGFQRMSVARVRDMWPRWWAKLESRRECIKLNAMVLPILIKKYWWLKWPAIMVSIAQLKIPPDPIGAIFMMPMGRWLLTPTLMMMTSQEQLRKIARTYRRTTRGALGRAASKAAATGGTAATRFGASRRRKAKDRAAASRN